MQLWKELKTDLFHQREFILQLKARNFGLALAGISLVLAFAISFTTTLEQGIWATIFIAFALVNNIIIYSYILKRNSRTNIILGGLCGGAPPMIGWVAVTMSDLWTMGLAMAGLVFILDSNAYLGFNVTFQRRL